MSDIFSIISDKAPVVPVLVVEDPAKAAPLAKALEDGGAVAVEVTLRTDEAVACLAEMKAACPSLLVGAGTVLTEGDIDACAKVGVDFIVTPGTSRTLAEALLESGIPTCPGVSTAGEALTMYEMGFDHQKFFPAAAAGGPAFVKALGGPLRNISFMPTGGISADNMNDYLKLENVFAVGGSWLAPANLVNEKTFDEITKRTKLAARLAATR